MHQRSSVPAVALVAVAVLVGWGLIGPFWTPPLGIDEHVSFWIADGSSPGGLMMRSLRYSATPPLSFSLQRLCLDAFGRTEWSLRLPAVACYSLAVVMAGWLASRAVSPMAGGLAALLLAVHPAVGRIAAVGRPYSLGLLLVVLAMHATERLSRVPNGRLHWAAWVAVNLALVFTHYLFAVFWLAQVIWLSAETRRRRGPLRPLAGCCLLLALGTAPLWPALLRLWQQRHFLNWTTRQPRIRDLLELALPVNVETVSDGCRWLVGVGGAGWLHQWLRPEAVLAVGLVVVPMVWLLLRRLGTGQGVVDERLWRSSSDLVRLSALCFFLPVGGLWLVGRLWITSLGAQRYLVAATPAAMVLVAALLCMIRSRFVVAWCIAMLLLSAGVPARMQQAAGALAASNGAQSGLGRSTDRAWQQVAEVIGRSRPAARLLLVGSGLTEMSLVPLYSDDPVFHDYVSSRLGRLYLAGPVQRLALPLFWTAGSEQWLKRVAGQFCSGTPVGQAKEPDRCLWLVVATDTDLLRASAARAQRLLQAAGLKQQRQLQWPALIAVQYVCP